MKKIKTMFLVFLLISVLLCGCSQVVATSADELKANKWFGELKNGTQVSLSFEYTSALLCIKTNADEGISKISGGCLVTDHDFIITDSSIGQIIHIDYKLNGDSVDLTYNNNTVKLNKQSAAPQTTGQ